jgi:hypothetical protein
MISSLYSTVKKMEDLIFLFRRNPGSCHWFHGSFSGFQGGFPTPLGAEVAIPHHSGGKTGIPEPGKYPVVPLFLISHNPEVIIRQTTGTGPEYW